MHERRVEHLARAGLVDHELQRLGLAHRCERARVPREHQRELGRPDVFRRDEARLRDRYAGLGDRDDVAGARDAADRVADEPREIVAGRDQARAHRDRDEPFGDAGLADRDRDHANTSAPSASAICSILYTREPLSRIASPRRTLAPQPGDRVVVVRVAHDGAAFGLHAARGVGGELAAREHDVRARRGDLADLLVHRRRVVAELRHAAEHRDAALRLFAAERGERRERARQRRVVGVEHQAHVVGQLDDLVAAVRQRHAADRFGERVRFRAARAALGAQQRRGERAREVAAVVVARKADRDAVRLRRAVRSDGPGGVGLDHDGALAVRRALVVDAVPHRRRGERSRALARRRVVEVEHRAARAGRHGPLRLRDAVARAHDLQVRFADVGEHADVGARRGDEHVEVAVLARAHLDDRHALVAVVQAAQKLRDAHLVVLVLRRRGDGDARAAQQREDELLGGRLAGAAGDGDHGAAHAAAREAAQIEISLQRVRARPAPRGRRGRRTRRRRSRRRRRARTLRPRTHGRRSSRRASARNVAPRSIARVSVCTRSDSGSAFSTRTCALVGCDRGLRRELHRRTVSARFEKAMRTSSRSSKGRVWSPTIW